PVGPDREAPGQGRGPGTEGPGAGPHRLDPHRGRGAAVGGGPRRRQGRPRPGGGRRGGLAPGLRAHEEDARRPAGLRPGLRPGRRRAEDEDRGGQPAEARVDALEGIKIKGEVTEIGSSAIPRGLTTQQTSSTNTANQAKDFKVEVTLKDPPASLRPGLNATADITTARKDKVLAVPIQAVVVREINKEGKVMDPAAVQAAESDPAAPPEKGQEKEGVFVV